MLFDPGCVLCGRPGDIVCRACEHLLPPAPGFPTPLHLDHCTALLAYDDTVASLLTGLKNRHQRQLVGWLADRLPHLTAGPGAVVTWAPTSAARRRARGFDQAELLARALARRWRLPAVALLRRSPGPPQAGRSGSARRGNPRFAAVGRSPHVTVLVDDVITTGATVTAAARALRSAGASEVVGVVAARARGARRAHVA